MICRNCGKTIHLVDPDRNRWGDGMWIICRDLDTIQYHEPDITDAEAIAGLRGILSEL